MDTMIPYFGVTVHFVKKQFKLQHYKLDICQIPHPYTSQNIKKIFNKIQLKIFIQKIKLYQLQVTMGIAQSKESDFEVYKNEQNNQNQFYYTRCATHILYLNVQQRLNHLE
ncbi:hypothetical protein ABPG72_014427 [Tetrahymena utriculariae]